MRRQRPPCRTLLDPTIVFALLLAAAGCGDDDSSGGLDPATATAICPNGGGFVRVTAAELGYDSIIRAFPVTAEAAMFRVIHESGCGLLDGPMGALNWFSFADRETYALYAARVATLVQENGGKFVFTGATDSVVERPEGELEVGAYIHEELALPLYASAHTFVQMLSSDAMQEIIPFQQAGAQTSDYVFVFQRCMQGCPNDLPVFPELPVWAFVHHFRYEGQDIDAAVARLSAQTDTAEGVSLIYAGRSIARPFLELEGDIEFPLNVDAWFDASLIFAATSPEAATSWINSETYAEFRNNTAEDVIAHIDPSAALIEE
jgi:uncharacterized protein (DUF1330 family)